MFTWFKGVPLNLKQHENFTPLKKLVSLKQAVIILWCEFLPLQTIQTCKWLVINFVCTKCSLLNKSEFRVTKQLDTCSSSPHEGMHFCWREQNNCWLSSQPMSRAGAEKFLWSCRAELMERGTYSDRVRSASPTGEVHATNVCTHGTERLFWQTYKPNGICYASGIWQHSTQRHCVSLHNTFSQTPPSARAYIPLRFRPQLLNAVSEFGFVQYLILWTNTCKT